MSETAAPAGGRELQPDGTVSSPRLVGADGAVDPATVATLTDIADVVRGDPANVTIWGFYEVAFNFPVGPNGYGAAHYDVDFPGGPPGAWPEWVVNGYLYNRSWADHVRWAVTSLANNGLRFWFTATNAGGPVDGSLYFCFIGRPN